MSVPIPPPAVGFTIPVLKVRPLVDPLVDEFGFDLRSRYVERFWLSALGPSTTLLLRRIADGFDESPDGFDLDLAATAGGLGLAARGGRHSPFMRALVRTTKFGLARLHSDTFDVRRRIPPMNLGQLNRLPEDLRDEHSAWLRAYGSPNAQPDRQRRARRLALGLLEAGDDASVIEHQLHQWQFHPALAHDAVRWAVERCRLEPSTSPNPDAVVASRPDAIATPRPAA